LTFRDGFADMLRGLHTREEVDDFIETRVLWPALAATHGSLPILRPRRQPVEPGRATRDAATARREPIKDAKRTESPSAPVTEAQSCEGIAAGVANTAGVPPLTTPGPAVAATNDAGAPAPATAAAGGQAGQTEPQTTTPEAHRSESFTLVDAEGEFIEVVGAVAVRSAFERAFLDHRLSLDRIVKLWEANKPAREAIERLFGADALREVAERVRAVEAAREARVTQGIRSTEHSGERPVQDPAAAAQGISATAESPARPGNKSVPPDAQSADEPPEPNGAGSATHSEPMPGSSPRRRARKRVDPNADLVLTIDRGWGDQKVFRYYRAALTAVHHREPGDTSEIARFREANAELETPLRAKLPAPMAEIDLRPCLRAPRQNAD
jgi:hypothetical protein